MPKKDDVEEKVAWYQSLTPTLQRHMQKSIRMGTKVIEERMARLLDAIKKDGGFKSSAEAMRWMKTSDPKNIEDLYLQLASVTDKDVRTHLERIINLETHRFGYTREMYLRDTIIVQNYRMVTDLRERGQTTLDDIVMMGFLYKSYEIAKKTRIGVSIGGFPKGLVRTLATSSLEATKTIGYFDTVSQGMKDELMKGIVSGQSNEQIARNIHTKMRDRELWVSRAFARTSICEVSAQAEKTCMEEAGIKRYTYRCTLDETTCPVCGAMDGRSFNVADAKAGVNYPPMHRNCRCTEVPLISEKASEGLRRRARGNKGKPITVPRTMTYREWAEIYAPKSAQKLPPIESK